MDSTSTLETHPPSEHTTGAADDVTTELAAPLAAASDRCPNCGSSMARDQRYCIECGERRSGGGLRDALPRAQTAAVAPAPARRARMSPNSSLIAGIATLLLAMGVGVLIGRTGDGSSKSSGNAPVQVVTVPSGSGAAAATAGTAAAAGAAKATSKSADKSKAAKTAAASKTAAAKAKAKLPPPVVKVGQPGHGKGYQHGKFTGNFFGQ